MGQTVSDFYFLAKDKLKMDLTLRPYSSGDFGDLCAMYDDFTPKGRAMGLPPACNQARKIWLSGIASEWTNLLAFINGRLIGHAALDYPGSDDGREFLIFIHQDFRNRGIGQMMTFLILDEARLCGCSKVWLMVESFNSIALSVYKKSGFRFCDCMSQERLMAVNPLESSRTMDFAQIRI